MVDAVLNQIRNTALIMGVIAFIGLALQKNLELKSLKVQ